MSWRRPAPRRRNAAARSPAKQVRESCGDGRAAVSRRTTWSKSNAQTDPEVGHPWRVPRLTRDCASAYTVPLMYAAALESARTPRIAQHAHSRRPGSSSTTHTHPRSTLGNATAVPNNVVPNVCSPKDKGLFQGRKCQQNVVAGAPPMHEPVLRWMDHLARDLLQRQKDRLGDQLLACVRKGDRPKTIRCGLVRLPRGTRRRLRDEYEKRRVEPVRDREATEHRKVHFLQNRHTYLAMAGPSAIGDAIGAKRRNARTPAEKRSSVSGSRVAPSGMGRACSRSRLTAT